MDRPIDRIRAKVQRAKQHVADFDLAVQTFGLQQPYAVGFKEDAKAGKRIYYVVRIDPVPLNVEGIAADALGNLREAVDHVAYQIELAACGAPPKHRVYFPIGRNAAHYRTVRGAYIKCAGKAAVDAFDAAEPYQGGKGHALWQLHELKVPDKHHLLVATRRNSLVDIGPTMRQLMRKGGPDWVQDIDVPHIMFREKDAGKTLEMGDELYIEPLDHDVEEDRQFAFEIAFDKPKVIEPEPALKTLQDLTNVVDDLVTAFGPLLP